MDEDEAKKRFHEANTKRSGGGGKNSAPEVLDVDEFVAFYFQLYKRPEVESLFEKYVIRKRRKMIDR